MNRHRPLSILTVLCTIGACCDAPAPPAFEIETTSASGSSSAAMVADEAPLGGGCLMQEPRTLLEPTADHPIKFAASIREAGPSYSAEIPEVGRVVFAREFSSENEGVTHWRGSADDGERLGYRIAGDRIEGEIQTAEYFFRFSSTGRSGHPEIRGYRLDSFAAKKTCGPCNSDPLPPIAAACVEPTSPLRDVLVLLALPVGSTGKGCDEDCRRQVCDNVESAKEIYRDEIYPAGGGELDVWIQRFGIKDSGIWDSLAKLQSQDKAYTAIFRVRDCLGADIVAVASPNSRNGLACFATDADLAFAAIGVGENSSDHTLAHEVSHVLGAGHQRFNSGESAGCRFGQFGYACGVDLMISSIGSKKLTTPSEYGACTALDRDSFNNPCLIRMSLNTAASFRQPPPPSASCRALVHRFVSHQACVTYLANEVQGVT